MIDRMLRDILLQNAAWAPAIAILGPRQSGKTTLAKKTFAKHRYVSLEEPANREFAISDPRGFLEDVQNAYGVILDEFQNVPSILSYLQSIIDAEQRPGYFILTGSQNFLINQAITQSLAGRIAIHTLLPLSIQELSQAHLLTEDPEEAIFMGGYPRLFGTLKVPVDWYGDYITTYVERDVRQVQAIIDLHAFQTFIRLCAGRIGQQLNLTSLGNECGISHHTVRSWLSLLEASYIVFLLEPYYKNFNKRLVKAPKLYFYDTGLACNLLRIESVEQLRTHYLRGGIFESYIMADLYKQYYNMGKRPGMYFWKDQAREVDCLIELSDRIIPIEIKAGKTINQNYFENLTYFGTVAEGSAANGYVIYAGRDDQKRSYAQVLNWQSAGTFIADHMR
jgi:predicted AAA+ superfamily ATPase